MSFTKDTDVTAIIPSRGRPELLNRAAISAVSQTDVRVEVVIILDGGRAPYAEPIHRHAANGKSTIRICALETTRGANVARNIGIDLASSPFVAFLDDDDVWLPRKLATQLSRLHEAPRPNHLILSSRTISVYDGRAVTGPTTLYNGGSVPDYLFLKRRLSSDRNLIHTSTLLMATEIVRKVRWTENLTRHQDWDFVLNAVRAGAEIVQHPVALTEIHHPVGSMSTAIDWRTSLAWAKSFRHDWSDRTYVDFLVGQPLRYALAARSMDGVRAVLRELRTTDTKLPTPNACALAASGLISRDRLSKWMHNVTNTLPTHAV